MKKLIFILLGIALIAGTKNETYAQGKTDKTVVYEVSMHCKSCKAKIEREMAFEKGIKEVTVLFDEKLVTVTYNDSKTTPEKISEAIKKLGYEVKEVDLKEKKENK